MSSGKSKGGYHREHTGNRVFPGWLGVLSPGCTHRNLELAPGEVERKKCARILGRAEIRRLRRGERGSGSDPAQFEHPVADVAILGQMGGSNSSSAGGHHLVKRAALKELGIELLAVFATPAGACVEAIDDGWINVFHERWLLGGRDWPSL
ncbi:MAG: hypothetical protein WA804_06210 [Terriglobales bacterium]